MRKGFSEKPRSNLILFTVIGLEALAFLPLPQDDELFVSLDSIAETEWVRVTNAWRGAFDVSLRGWRLACQNLFVLSAFFNI